MGNSPIKCFDMDQLDQLDTFPDSVNVQLLLFSRTETEDVIVW